MNTSKGTLPDQKSIAEEFGTYFCLVGVLDECDSAAINEIRTPCLWP